MGIGTYQSLVLSKPSEPLLDGVLMVYTLWSGKGRQREISVIIYGKVDRNEARHSERIFKQSLVSYQHKGKGCSALYCFLSICGDSTRLYLTIVLLPKDANGNHLPNNGFMNGRQLTAHQHLASQFKKKNHFQCKRTSAARISKCRPVDDTKLAHRNYIARP